MHHDQSCRERSVAFASVRALALSCALAATLAPAGGASAASPAASTVRPAATAAHAPDLPPPFATPSVVRPARVVGWPEGTTPRAPQNFRVQAFARDLDNPRWMLVLPNGDVLVAEARTVLTEARRRSLPPELLERFQRNQPQASANRITLLRDADGDGVAETRHVLIEDLNQPFGMALRRDRLFIANTDGVLSCPFLVGQTRIRGGCRTVLELPADGYNNHWTRNIVFSPDESRLFVAVGSATNVDEERQDALDPRRAAILVARPDGRESRVYAAGLRNPVGLAFEPVTGRLWTTVNERDELGDDLVPDYMTSVREGAFYGWPYAYLGPNEDPRKKGERPDLVAKTVVPDHAFGAHVAALGLAFYQRDAFPKEYRGGAFVAQRGSWNRSELAGYRVVHVPFANGRPAGPEQVFLDGFLADAEEATAHGRPVGVAVARDGALLVADDAGNTIWRVAFKCGSCTPDP